MVPLETNYLSIYRTDLHQIFAGMVDQWVQILNVSFALRALKIRCHGKLAASFGAKSTKLIDPSYPTFIRRAGIPKRIGLSQRR